MFTIDGKNKIKLTKGDTATMLVEVKDLEGKQYVIKPTDTITLTVRKTPNSDVAFRKEATEEHFIIINHSDTTNLDSGLYVYDLQLITKDGYVYTIIPFSYFEIASEVTF